MSLDDRQREGLASLGVEVAFDVPLSEHTWLGIGGPADAIVVEPADDDGRRLVRRWCRRERLAINPVPTGPGVVVRQGGLAGILLLGPPPTAPEGLERGKDRLFRDPDLGSGASRLLADSGAGGIRLRGVRLDEHDPNVVVHLGGATAADVLALADWLKREVHGRTGVQLELAISVVGRRQLSGRN